MGTLDYKIIDDFLNKDEFKNLQEIIMSPDFPWFFQNHQVTDDDPFFSHIIFSKNKINSVFYKLFYNTFLNKLNCKALDEIRLNLLINRKEHLFSNWHIDRPYKCHTALFYINTNNGYTLLDEKEKIKIESIENRMLIFNSQIKHVAVSQVDVIRRIVINFNYF
jgi:hypothetical protein